MKITAKFLLIAAAGIPLMAGSADGPQSRVIVTAKPAGDLKAGDVRVELNHERAEVTGAVRLRRDPAGTDLWILIDDGIDQSLGNQLGDLRNFIAAQPPSTQVGVGYLRYGDVTVAQAPTVDHERAAKALRLPTGPPGISASPYIAIGQFVRKHKLERGNVEALVITSGVDPYYAGPDDPYLNQAVAAAQKAGVIVNAIYFGRGPYADFWGQRNLSQMTRETGGELYWQGNGLPVGLAPFLDQLNERLNDQYLLTFVAPGSKRGLERVRFSTEATGTKVTGPSSVNIN